jgi:hypothetical protein
MEFGGRWDNDCMIGNMEDVWHGSLCAANLRFFSFVPYLLEIARYPYSSKGADCTFFLFNEVVLAIDESMVSLTVTVMEQDCNASSQSDDLELSANISSLKAMAGGFDQALCSMYACSSGLSVSRIPAAKFSSWRNPQIV